MRESSLLTRIAATELTIHADHPTGITDLSVNRQIVPNNRFANRAAGILVMDSRPNIGRLASAKIGGASVKERDDFFMWSEEWYIPKEPERGNVLRTFDSGEFFVECHGHIIRGIRGDILNCDKKQAVLKHKIHDYHWLVFAGCHDTTRRFN
jgi:hypothetical protein